MLRKLLLSLCLLPMAMYVFAACTIDDPCDPTDCGDLNLTIDKAYHLLGWLPKWSFEETVQHTVTWYRQFYEYRQGKPNSIRELTQNQIREYSKGLTYVVKD